MAIYRKEDMIEYYQSKGYTFEKNWRIKYVIKLFTIPSLTCMRLELYKRKEQVEIGYTL